MKVLKRVLLTIVILTIVIVAALFIYLQTTKPQLSGEISLQGLSAEVEVLYDEFGIPHIYAQNEEDAYFALGYVHAQDRLFQMEMLRRAAGGRLSEVLGPDLLEIDKLFRTLGINQFAREHAEKFLGSDTSSFQQAAHAYQKGINAFVKFGETPIEFIIIGIPKTEFTPEDMYLANGFMSFGFAEGFQADPVLEKIRSELGEEYLTDLAVHTPAYAERIRNFNGTVKKGAHDQLITSIRTALDKLPVPLWQGSNGWVVSAEKSESGFPILANDTHIGFGQPAVWYEAHLEYPGFSFYGHHLAGIPFGLLGNNRYCGIGLTMFENDDVDFFKEESNPENSNQVKFKGQWEDLTTREEVIKVKGEPDVILAVKSSRHGPIANGIVQNVDTVGQPVAVSWLLMKSETMALQAFYQLNHATSFDQAERAVSSLTSPGLNVMYGDVDGNIAWWAAAKLPVRPSHVVSKLFLNGSTGEDEYLGSYDFSKNPKAINPPWGFVYSANNQPDTVDGILYPGYYYPSRGERIVELLSKKEKFSAEDMKALNLDVVSGMYKQIAGELARVLEASKTQSSYSNEEGSAVIESLKAWEGDHPSTATAPAIYHNLLSQVIFLSMQDEIGKEALKSLLTTSVPRSALTSFIANEASPWWDNVQTEKRESREDIVVIAAEKTISLLKKTCGNNPADWTWGKIHTLTHNHPLGMVKPLDRVFNVGPFVVGGSNDVPNCLGFDIDTTGYFPVTYGPALRKITDFANIENGETVSPTGQSGNLMSPHYSDQAEMFATGKSRKMMMNREEIEKKAKNKLVLKP